MSGSELFPFTEEQLMIQNTAGDFAQKEIVPIAAEFDDSGEFPLLQFLQAQLVSQLVGDQSF